MKNWLKHAMPPPLDIAEQYPLTLYSGIIDFNSCMLFRVNENKLTEWKERSVNEIDFFWGLLKSRILKNRGLHDSTIYLHVKETEFRYNHRKEDLFVLLNGILNKRPLHIIRAIVL
jgi:transposase